MKKIPVNWVWQKYIYKDEKDSSNDSTEKLKQIKDGWFYLISYKHFDNVLIGGVGFELVEPVFNLDEGVAVGHVVDEDHALPASVVARGQCPEPLLACCVPDRKFDLIEI